MKSPRLIRLLLMLGVFVMVLAILSYGMLPGWRSSAWGSVLLIAGVGLGLAAIIKDMTDLIREIRRIEEEEKTNKRE